MFAKKRHVLEFVMEKHVFFRDFCSPSLVSPSLNAGMTQVFHCDKYEVEDTFEKDIQDIYNSKPLLFYSQTVRAVTPTISTYKQTDR